MFLLARNEKVSNILHDFKTYVYEINQYQTFYKFIFKLLFIKS